MKRIRVRRGVPGVALLLTAVLAIAAGVPTRSAAPDSEWRAWAADKASTRYSPLDQINFKTVNDLRIAWRQSANPERLKQLIPNLRPPTNYQNTPLMIGGLLYISTGMVRATTHC
jgi:quinoprotein glucose dehydrogenase